MNGSVLRFPLPLPLLCAALFASALAACGSDASKGSAGARALLAQSAKSTASALKSAHLDARLQLEPEGLLALGGPVVVHVAGPIERPAAKGLPLADLAAEATIARRRYPIGLVADGRSAFLMLDGSAYKLDGRSLGGLGRGAAKDAGAHRRALGVDPSRWISDPQDKGDERVGGVDTTHIAGDVDVPKLLQDLGDLIPAAQRTQIAGAITSASAEVWAGQTDKILRQLVVTVRFRFPEGSKPPIPGLDAGKVSLRVLLENVNRTSARVTTPKHAKALSQLPSDKGLAGLIACLSGAGAKSADLARCAAKLGP